MKAKTHCPVCEKPMNWLLHDGPNIYTCCSSRLEHTCPISFEETVWYPVDFNFNNTIEDVLEGKLLSFSFIVQPYLVKIILGEHPVFTVKRITERPDGRLNYKKVFQIPYTFEIDWQHLDNFEQKLKTWILFS